jgi:exonuclease SbcD
MAFSFIHSGDLHLDSPFRGVTSESPEIARQLQSATFDAYHSLIKLCIDKHVQFLLLSGDIYDGADRSLRAQLRFRDGLQQLADSNIQVFIVHGNHDPYKGHSGLIKWPPGIHVFSYSKVESKPVKVNGNTIAVVSGISHEKSDTHINLAKKYNATDADVFQIGLLHCNVGRNTGHDAYAPCELNDLLGIGMHYWALGHVHERKILCKNPYVVYPGNPQGLSIREQNQRGCYLVRVDESTKEVFKLEFHELDVIRWFSGSVKINGLQTLDQLENNISNRIDHFVDKANSRPIIVRLSIEGQGPLYPVLHRDGSIQDLLLRIREIFENKSPFVWVEELIFNCKPEIDIEERRKNQDFLGQILKISKEFSKEDGMQRLRAEALGELYQDLRVKKHLDDVTDEEIEDMLKKAELLCIDMFEA